MNFVSNSQFDSLFRPKCFVEYPQSVSSYSSPRNILTNESRIVRTFPVNLLPNPKYKRGIFLKTQQPEDELLYGSHKNDLFNLLDAQIQTKDKAKKYRTISAGSSQDMKDAQSKLHSLKESFQTTSQTKLAQSSIKYSDFKEKHASFHKNKSQVSLIKQMQQNKRDYNDFAIGGNSYNPQSKSNKLLLFKPKAVKLSTRSSINVFVKNEYWGLNKAAIKDKIRINKTTTDSKFLKQQQILRCLSPQSPPAPNPKTSSCKKLNEILYSHQMKNFKQVKEDVLKLVYNKPRVRNTLGNRIEALQINYEV